MIGLRYTFVSATKLGGRVASCDSSSSSLTLCGWPHNNAHAQLRVHTWGTGTLNVFLTCNVIGQSIFDSDYTYVHTCILRLFQAMVPLCELWKAAARTMLGRSLVQLIKYLLETSRFGDVRCSSTYNWHDCLLTAASPPFACSLYKSTKLAVSPRDIDMHVSTTFHSVDHPMIVRCDFQIFLHAFQYQCILIIPNNDTY